MLRRNFPTALGFCNIVTFYLLAINCTSVVGKFLPNVKEIFAKALEVKKNKSMYVIYKRIESSYYGNIDDENGILKQVEHPAEEDLQTRALREWKSIDYIYREARLTIKSADFIANKLVLFEEDEHVVEEMGE